MLNYLSVKNVSVIESVSFELGGGLTVLTGETGSGKSVLVGALKLLLGERFQKTMLREGAEKLSVEGVFEGPFVIPPDLSEQYDIEDQLIIRREVDQAGKNRIYINDRPATVTALKEFAPYLADIHGQHEHQALLDESRHMELIDHIVPDAVLTEYASAYAVWAQAKKDYDKMAAGIDEITRHREIAAFQLNEIEAAAINIETDSRIDEDIAFLSNIEKIREACATTITALSEGEMNASDFIIQSVKSLEPLSENIKELATAVELLNSAFSAVQDAVKTVEVMYEVQDAPLGELDKLMQRRYQLLELRKKYGGSLESVLEKHASLSEAMKSYESGGQELNKLEEAAEKALQKAVQAADKLYDARQKAADEIAREVEKILEDLELAGGRLKTVFTRHETPDAAGGMSAAFHISVNKGFEPAPLAQIASGGEISRVMLALKEVFSDSDRTPTLLFDEIDTGISGRSAKKVAHKLKQLGRKKQIIAITHLPVVAAAGNAHFHIEKDAASDRSKTTVTPVENADRRNIIARMIAGTETAAAIMQAEELLRDS